MSAPESVASTRITKFDGGVSLLRKGRVIQLENTSSLKSGDQILTSRNGTSRVEFDRGSVDLAPGSLLKVRRYRVGTKKKRRWVWEIKLLYGHAEVRLKEGPAAFRFQTPFASVEARKGQFIVSVLHAEKELLERVAGRKLAPTVPDRRQVSRGRFQVSKGKSFVQVSSVRSVARVRPTGSNSKQVTLVPGEVLKVRNGKVEFAATTVGSEEIRIFRSRLGFRFR